MRLLGVAILLIAAGPSLEAAEPCRADATIRERLAAAREGRGKVPFADYVAGRKKAARDLIAEYPNVVEPYRELAAIGQLLEPEFTRELIDEWVAKAEANPGDAVAQYNAGRILEHHKPERAIELLENARALDSNLYWAYLSLANTYSRVPFEDGDKAAEALAAYFDLCPTSIYGYAHSLLGRLGRVETKRKVAEALRASLPQETDRDRLKGFAKLWSLEFATTPGTEHGRLRKQVAKDVKRLDKLKVEDDAAWLGVIQLGYQQSKGLDSVRDRIEKRLLEAEPRSYAAYRLHARAQARNNPKPDKDASHGAWQKYLTEEIKTHVNWVAWFDNSLTLERTLLRLAVHNDSVTNTDVIKQAQKMLAAYNRYNGVHFHNPRFEAAEGLAHRGVALRAALQFAHGADRYSKLHHERRAAAPDISASARAREELALARDNQRYLRIVLDIFRQLGDAEAAEALRERVESTAPTDDDLLPGHSYLVGLLAENTGGLEEALENYRTALVSRKAPPAPLYGQPNDPVQAAAERVFRAAGGDDDGWKQFLKDVADTPKPLTEGRWEEHDRDLPAFEFSDLKGETWNLSSLEGRSVLINFWATWCPPCQAELPKLQKLYEKTKKRDDIAILTINIDSQLGLVAPYVRRRNFTFPVILAHDYFSTNSDYQGIPTNWIIDPDGNLRWVQVGFDRKESKWAERMLEKLTSAQN